MKTNFRIDKHLKSILSISMLMLYLSVFLLAPLLEHYHQHSHNNHECTEENEVDPCHRLIFHNDISEGCEHTEHLLAEDQSCDLCDLILTSNPKILFELAEQPNFDHSIILSFTEANNNALVVLFSKSARAPPSLTIT